jgi:hypothetical protein
LKNEFKNQGIPFPNGFETALEDFFRSLKRKDAMKRQRGETKAKEGKEKMPFGLYRWLCHYFLSKCMIFEWVYLVSCWNLMCRTNNIAQISLSHLSWDEDSLCVVVPKTKTDQGVFLSPFAMLILALRILFVGGEKVGDGFHVYANSQCPEICPILALGVWLITTDFGLKNQLFPGGPSWSFFFSSLL